MFLKHWILLTALLAVAYAAIEPLNLTPIETTQDVSQPEQHVREKRFILAKKAFLLGGALGLGIGLVKGKLLAGALNQVGQSYPAYSEPSYYQPAYQPNYYGGESDWSGSNAYASAAASSW